MNALDLAQRYDAIGKHLRDIPAYQGLGIDYQYVARLIREESDMPHLIGELRRNLNRSRNYFGCQRRNKALHVMAKTLERIERQAEEACAAIPHNPSSRFCSCMACSKGE